jgi:hypothetical protein
LQNSHCRFRHICEIVHVNYFADWDVTIKGKLGVMIQELSQENIILVLAPGLSEVRNNVCQVFNAHLHLLLGSELWFEICYHEGNICHLIVEGS